MTRTFAWLAAALLASVVALPASAQIGKQGAAGGGGGGHAAVSGGRAVTGGGAHFGGQGLVSRGGGHAFSSQIGRGSVLSRGGGNALIRHSNRSVHNFATGHGLNRSVQHSRRIDTVTHNGRINNGLHNRRIDTVHNRRTDTVLGQTRRSHRDLQTGALRHGNGNRMSVLSQAAHQGRFGSRFATRSQFGHQRFANLAAHRAWRHHWRANFVAWYGPVFWPYAYSDIFDYAFWPYGYDDGYWAFAYDDFIDSMFWGEAVLPPAYAAVETTGSLAPAPRVSYSGVQQLCQQPGSGITAWPFAQIERKVGLNAEQRVLLGDVRKAAADAAATFKASCPTENTFPLTPPGRLAAMTARLQGTLDAVKIVRPPLEKFYASLSDEQKERFNELGPKTAANNSVASAALPQDAKACTEAKPGLSTLPIERIAGVVKPTDAQQGDLTQLQDATGKAVSILQAACPDEIPLTPPGRLAAMQIRLQAMVDAARTVKPALDTFYSSLTDEQKARFDRLGRELAQNNG